MSGDLCFLIEDVNQSLVGELSNGESFKMKVKALFSPGRGSFLKKNKKELA